MSSTTLHTQPQYQASPASPLQQQQPRVGTTAMASYTSSQLQLQGLNGRPTLGKDTLTFGASSKKPASPNSASSSSTSSATMVGHLPQQAASHASRGLFGTIKHWGLRAIQTLFAVFTLDFVFKLFTGR